MQCSTVLCTINSTVFAVRSQLLFEQKQADPSLVFQTWLLLEEIRYILRATKYATSVLVATLPSVTKSFKKKFTSGKPMKSATKPV